MVEQQYELATYHIRLTKSLDTYTDNIMAAFRSGRAKSTDSGPSDDVGEDEGHNKQHQEEEKREQVEESGIDSSSGSNSSQPSRRKLKPPTSFKRLIKRSKNSQSSSSQDEEEPAPPPSMGGIPDYISALEKATKTADNAAAATANPPAAHALRALFALSEDAAVPENRVVMVSGNEGRLVLALLHFLEKCEHESSEHYLTLLVLNNISIPAVNKKPIAIDHGGARILARLLCDDPSCYLVAIVLVNLTFCDAELRSQLVAPESDIHLVESLSFCLRVTSLSHGEYEHRQPLVENDPENPRSPGDLLSALLAEDQNQGVPIDEDISTSSVGTRGSHRSGALAMVVPDASQQLFPETARWCLTAMKNLTRPSDDTTTGLYLIASHIVPHILRFVTIPSATHCLSVSEDSSSSSDDINEKNPYPTDEKDENEKKDDQGVTDISDSSQVSDLETPEIIVNAPASWDGHTAQDAALFVILNLSAAPSVREYIREIGGIDVLRMVVNYDGDLKSPKLSPDELSIVEFQRLKARMALSYLVASEGQYGQPSFHYAVTTWTPDTMDERLGTSDLLLTDGEIARLVELLSNTIHGHSKSGPGGYSAATFSLKYVLLAIRCLVTHRENQIKFAVNMPVALNTLLLKALASFTLLRSPSMDQESAEFACFSLYLLSRWGFTLSFFPNSVGADDWKRSFAAKVLYQYHNSADVTPAGKHAAQQLLLRLRHLIFTGRPSQVLNMAGFQSSDLSIEDNMFAVAEKIMVLNRRAGAKPSHYVFDRPLLRARVLREGSENKLRWDNDSVDTYPSALDAVLELSYGSVKVRHLEDVDDVRIANNIANCANGDKTESYSYMWSWKDTVGEIQKNLEGQRSAESSQNKAATTKVPEDPIELISKRLGSFVCGLDSSSADVN